MSTDTLKHSVGEYVVYKKHGIYEIAEIRKDKICGLLRTYYILKSVYDSNATVYVPADCENLVSQMEHVLTSEEIEDIIEKSRSTELCWIDNTQERAMALEELVNSGDLTKIIAMLMLLSEKKQEALRNKTKTFAHDERMLGAATKIVSEAFAFTLGLDKRDVVAYIEEQLCN